MNAATKKQAEQASMTPEFLLSEIASVALRFFDLYYRRIDLKTDADRERQALLARQLRSKAQQALMRY